MEREGGLAVDELVVSLPADVSVALAAKEVNSVDGAELEDIRPIEGTDRARVPCRAFFLGLRDGAGRRGSGFVG